MNTSKYLSRPVAKILFILTVSNPAFASQDGVCKTEIIPTDYVAVEEFYSPECGDGSNPFVKNAWRVERVKDGVTVCKIPDYKTMGARVAELISCDNVYSDKCAVRLDGLPNAVVLRSPAECLNRGLPSDIALRCHRPGDHEIGPAANASGYTIGYLKTPKCPMTGTGFNALLVRIVDQKGSATLSICAGQFNYSEHDVIVRRFHSSNCEGDH